MLTIPEVSFDDAVRSVMAKLERDNEGNPNGIEVAETIASIDVRRREDMPNQLVVTVEFVYANNVPAPSRRFGVAETGIMWTEWRSKPTDSWQLVRNHFRGDD